MKYTRVFGSWLIVVSALVNVHVSKPVIASLDNAFEESQFSPIIPFEDISDHIQEYGGKLVLVVGKLNSLIIRHNRSTLAIDAGLGSPIFVRSQGRPEGARTGSVVQIVARVSEGESPAKHLKFVRFQNGALPVKKDEGSRNLNLSRQNISDPNVTRQESNGIIPRPSTNNPVIVVPSSDEMLVQLSSDNQINLEVRQLKDKISKNGIAYYQGNSSPVLFKRSPVSWSPESPAIRVQVAKLKPAYKNAIKSFNPILPDGVADVITTSLLYYSILYGVDPRFSFAVIVTESSFDPRAIGTKGEKGLGQLMPGTAKSLGVTDPLDPVQNLEGSVRLLRHHLDRYSNLTLEDQITHTLAAYNAGPGRVAQFGGVPPYPLTKRYIHKVTSLYRQLTSSPQ